MDLVSVDADAVRPLDSYVSASLLSKNQKNPSGVRRQRHANLNPPERRWPRPGVTPTRSRKKFCFVHGPSRRGPRVVLLTK